MTTIDYIQTLLENKTEFPSPISVDEATAYSGPNLSVEALQFRCTENCGRTF